MNDSEIASLLSLKEETQEPPDTSQLDAFVAKYEVMAEENHALRQDNEILRCQLATVTGVYPVTSLPAGDLAQLPPYRAESYLAAFNGIGGHRGNG